MPKAYNHFSACIKLGLTTSIVLLCGCQHVNVAQLTYEALRAEDCRRNQLEDFCGRTYAFDYHEYRRLRQDFLHAQENLQQQGSRNEVILEGSSLHKVLNTQ